VAELRLWGLNREFAFADPAAAGGAVPAESRDAGSAAGSGGGNAAGGGVPLIKGWAEVLGEVSDHQALVGSLKQSPYAPLFKVRRGREGRGVTPNCGMLAKVCRRPRAGAFPPPSRPAHHPPSQQDEVAAWEAKLVLLQEGLASLAAIQRKWLYLAPIFARGTLPGQQGRFGGVDGEFRAVVAHLHVSGALWRGTLRWNVGAGSVLVPSAVKHLAHNPRNVALTPDLLLPPPQPQASRKVLAFTEMPCPRERLAGMAAALDACQRALSDYLEDKRAAFPRWVEGGGGLEGWERVRGPLRRHLLPCRSEYLNLGRGPVSNPLSNRPPTVCLLSPPSPCPPPPSRQLLLPG
jgi:hypothetical protein